MFAINNSKHKGIEDYRKELFQINPQIEITDDRIFAGRKVSAKNPEDMLKFGSVASMGLPKYL